MTQATLKNNNSNGRKFIPKTVNFETSLRYEGLAVKKEDNGKSVNELKQKYAQ